ncbi:S41 family peptidase [Mariniflexile litorale]|uniref:S41 family peptidase n=1 Tax=Mariniflexile litorale TaxID=3045158 RepID=A0AAU7EHK5_9FLAO|nr:S41 family peptidase [Mariniflexile sp. KMM 9835]MDQ8210775.1 S41 family peptidase [Mariniflexile sp. KMM 9835]
MKFTKALILVFTISFLTTACFDDNDDSQITTSEINDFVWKGMNSWYNWQSEVPNLSDNKDDNKSEYQSYLTQNTNPNIFFNSLIYQPNVTDRFSWFIEDYIEQELQFQGISKSHGLKYQSVQVNSNGDIIIYVRYAADNSPASAASIKRGDIINAINGTVLNSSNFDSAINDLFDDTVTLSFVSENGGVLTPIESKTITATVISENPVYLKKIFNDINNKKVGYLVYNGFRSSYNDELNDAFAFFKNEGIDELILDLRLNGGGSVATSAYLSSMIYANANEGEFASLEFNSKHAAENGSYFFTNTLNVYDANDNKTGTQAINRLNTLSRLYVLTSSSTASASEMVINGLKPYMSAVKVIGSTTYGKNVGSITLYDSPNTDYQDKSSANQQHTYAMQPIVFQIFNKNGQSDYTQGFVPDTEVKEYEYWNTILPFGDENEVVLKAALDDIRGITSKTSSSKKKDFAKELKFKTPFKKFENEMYIEKDFFGKE